jgi:Uma2 family endonuclease
MGRREATIEDLYRVDGKAEIVGGEIVLMSPTGRLHGFASLEIAVSLREHSRRTGRGVAFADNVGFVVNLPNRRSFCPDAAFWTGPLTAKFADGAPVFAVEVRSEEEFGPAAERAMRDKRADYFAAGTLVVWDVDVQRDCVVRVYRASDPTSAAVYRRGEMADAEPAVPGWSMPADDLLPASNPDPS